MLRSNKRSLWNHVVSPEEEKERLQWEGFVEKEGFNQKLCYHRRTARRAMSVETLSVVATSSTTVTHPRQIEATELKYHDRQTCSKLCGSECTASTLQFRRHCVNKLDRR